MPTWTMKSGSQMLQSFLEVGVPASLKASGHFCFSCEQIFANRKCLEDHLCPSASFICSCGTEFTEYKGMLEHSTTHAPGQQVLNHMTIKKRRIEKFLEQEEKLKRLQKGEVIWSSPNAAVRPSVSGHKSSAAVPLPMETVQIPQVPVSNASLSEASLSNPLPAAKGMQNLYSDVGAPTVDLWTLYQPVVLVPTIRKLQKPYICGKCGQGFVSKAPLVSHYNLHIADKVSGCIGCGLLLSGRKQVPRFHSCNSPVTNKFKLITAKPPSYKSPIKDNVRKNLFAQPLQATSALKLENLIPSAASKVRRPAPVTAAQKNFRTYNNNVHVGSVFQPKILNPIAPKPSISVSLTSKSPNLSVFSQKISIPPTVLLKMPTNSESLSGEGEFMCRVCHLPFRTAQILQRHKCVKAQEFMAKHVIGGKLQPKLPLSMGGPNLAQVNGEGKPGFPPSVGTKNNQLAVGVDKGKAVVPGNKKTGEDDNDDDCFIVEDGSNKPAEMIYQVTSSVPIKI